MLCVRSGDALVDWEVDVIVSIRVGEGDGDFTHAHRDEYEHDEDDRREVRLEAAEGIPAIRGEW